MKLAVLVLAVLASLGGAAAVSTDTFAVFKCTVKLPVVFQTTNGQGQQVLATKTLKSADIVNLALGRPLSTKLDAATEVLAFASDVSTPGAGSMIVVFNPATDQVTTTVLTTANFVLLANQDFSKNSAFCDGSIVATTLGDPAHDGFGATTIAMGGTGKSSGSFASTSVAGPISFTFTSNAVTTAIDGLVLKGTVKASGPQLALLQGL